MALSPILRFVSEVLTRCAILYAQAHYSAHACIEEDHHISRGKEAAMLSNGLYRFDVDKAIEVLLYVAEQTHDMYNVLKSLYFADQEHLRLYGRLICGDDYYALDYGPVPSGLYDLIKDVRDKRPRGTDPRLSTAFKVQGDDVVLPLRRANVDYLRRIGH